MGQPRPNSGGRRLFLWMGLLLVTLGSVLPSERCLRRASFRGCVASLHCSFRILMLVLDRFPSTLIAEEGLGATEVL